MKKFLSILFLSVLFQNSYSFNLCSPFDASNNEYAYLNELSEEEIIKEIVDNTYEDEIGIISWIKNVISYVRKTKSEKVEEVVSKIIIWDKKLPNEKILQNNINNIKKLVFKIAYDVYKMMPSDFIVDMAKEEDIDLSLISDLESFTKYIEENLEEDIDEKEDWVDPLNNQNPLFYAFSIDNVVLSKVFLDKGIKVQDCLYDRGFYFNEYGQKDFFDGPILPVIAGIGYNSFNLFLDNYCTNINAVILDDGDENFRLIEFAVMNGYGDIVKKLLDKGAQNKRYEEEEGVLYRGALLTAVTFNNFDMVKLLVKNGVDINDYSEDGSALFIAVNNNLQEVARYLIKMGAFVEYDLLFADCDDELKEYIKDTLKSKYKISDLHIACFLGQVYVVDNLLKNGVDPNIKNDNLQTPLHSIMENYSYSKNKNTVLLDDYLKIIDLLLERGANINEKDLNGNTPLILAANRRFSKTLFKYLLEKGADIRITNKGDKSALGYLVYSGLLRSFIDDYDSSNENSTNNFFDNFINYKFSMKNLFSIKDYYYFDILYYLSVLYENYDYSYGIGLSSYLVDSAKRDLDKIKEYFNFDNRYFSDGLNHLHIAVVNSNKFMTDYWIENGFDINSVDLEGKSVLFFVQNIDMAKKVLKLGVDFKIKDFKGRTALDYIKELGNDEMVKFLETFQDSNIDELA